MTGAELVPIVKHGAVMTVVRKVGEGLWALTGRKLKPKWQKLFEKRNFLVLGEEQSGKTSLIWLLTKGRPYDIDDGGVVMPPDRTHGKTDVERVIKLGTRLKVKVDVGGDPAWHGHWATAIEGQRPHGIIYMVDGRRTDLPKAADKLCKLVLDKHYAAQPGQLAALHVFLNFKDEWGGSPAAVREKIQKFDALLAKRRKTRAHLDTVAMCVHATQLSQRGTPWEEADRAARKFALDIAL